jgi:hypothetical protein
MTGPRAVQSFGSTAALLVGLWLVFAGACTAAAIANPTQDLRHPAIILSAWYAFGAWYAACVLMLRLAPADWVKLTPRLRIARLCWTLGLAMHVLHVLFAFGLGHGWSHAAAVEHVARTGGFGWGIVVNYAFAAVWLADVIWWWAKPAGYAARSRRAGRGVHCFLVFVTFNATVVFGPETTRLACGILFAALAVQVKKS